MAGAGYKLFNTGDVLTAAQVNTYLMQQTVMVFASSAARTSALSGVLAEGMVSYLQDTNTLEVYDGSAWVGATGDITGLTAGTGISISSATGPVPTITSDVATTFDAKGDLVVGTGADTFSKLTVGNSGDTIVADSSASTGLRWQGSISAGKNVVINGGMDFWQRGTSFSNAHGYNADRWLATGATAVPVQTISRQTLTAGDLAGTGLQYFWRQNVTNVNGATNISNQHRIEGVETFAGQTVTLSFYAKADSSRTISAALNQNFGSGGSGDVFGGTTNFNLTTSWVRYSTTVTLASISGKTIGTGNFLYISFTMPVSTFTIDITGVQLELGSVATAFSRAGGTLAGEVLACQRYYWRWTAGDAYTGFGLVIKTTTTAANWYLQNPVEMRARPSSLEFSTLMLGNGAASAAVTAMTLGWWSKNSARVDITNNAFGAGDTPAGIFANNSTSAYFAINAEL